MEHKELIEKHNGSHQSGKGIAQDPASNMVEADIEVKSKIELAKTAINVKPGRGMRENGDRYICLRS